VSVAHIPRPDGLRRRDPLGQILLRKGLVTGDQLAAALETQRRSGDRLGRILVSLGYVNQLAVARALAEQFGLPFRDLLADPPPAELVRLLDEDTARRFRAVPVAVEGDLVEVAVADPGDEAGLAAVASRLGRPVRWVVTGELDIYRTLERVYRDVYLDRARSDLLLRHPDQSAHETITKTQLLAALSILAALFAGLLLAGQTVEILAGALVTLVYAALSAYRLYLMWRALSSTSELEVTADELAALNEKTLPEYTVLVPLYRETEVLPALLKALAALDYPASKLDIKLIFDEDDPETLALARQLRPPGHFKFLVVPAGWPRTKPKALNYGLIQATGEYCVIYDAEDIPEPDQLKKAVIAFRKAPRGVVCLQARLSFYNRDQNPLTRWFTAEYAQWFDLTLPGLHATGGVIPLGGNSNHFVTEKVRQLGAWDPYNVTEDADLGVRLARAGYRTAMFNSTTYEEANSELANWVRQRTRWLKGWMQTWLVHMRDPGRLLKELGPWGFFSFQAVIGGTLFVALANPILWALTTIWFVGRWAEIEALFPGPVFYLTVLNLYLGNFLFAYLYALGAALRGYHQVVPYGLLAPVYWFLLSVAAWRAVFHLLFRPFYWEKTVHGLHLQAEKASA
jgi:cellulose synthase/poly-beta-1,6-N-acetylglucosamine synthase-like glycosyltransferase